MVWTEAWPRELYLLQLAAGGATEFRGGPSQVMGRDSGDARSRRVRPQELPHHLLRQPVASQLVAAMHRPENVAVRYAGARVQASMATFTQVGIGTVRTRLCFETRSRITHRPSRC